MAILELRLQHFRCHGTFAATFSPHLNLILGNNGRGKTALLEAIHYVSQLHSFRTSVTRELVQHNREEFSIRLQDNNDFLKVNWSPRKKELWFNETSVKAIDFLGAFSCVALTTGDIVLARGGAEMRQFLNQILAQWDKKNLVAILRYQKILKERNAWLKNEFGNEKVFQSLTHQLETTGKPLQRSRYHLTRLLEKVATFFYQKISNSSEALTLSYQSNPWSHPFEIEKQLSYSLNGFHRDKINFLLDQKPLAPYGSEGQQRSAVIALKLAEIFLLHRKQKKAPLVLIDDIWGELDAQRRKNLLEFAQEPYQIFVTATDLNWLGENDVQTFDSILKL